MLARLFLAALFVLSGLSLSGCGGGVGVDASGNLTFTGYVTIPPTYGNPVVNPPQVQGFPASCIVQDHNFYNTYILYGAGYAGCPQLAGRDLVRLFELTYPNIWVDSWTYPSFGTARITLR